MEYKPKILVAGSSGYLGSSITSYLNDIYDLVLSSRKSKLNSELIFLNEQNCSKYRT